MLGMVGGRRAQGCGRREPSPASAAPPYGYGAPSESEILDEARVDLEYPSTTSPPPPPPNPKLPPLLSHPPTHPSTPPPRTPVTFCPLGHTMSTSQRILPVLTPVDNGTDSDDFEAPSNLSPRQSLLKQTSETGKGLSVITSAGMLAADPLIDSGSSISLLGLRDAESQVTHIDPH